MIKGNWALVMDSIVLYFLSLAETGKLFIVDSISVTFFLQAWSGYNCLTLLDVIFPFV